MKKNILHSELIKKVFLLITIGFISIQGFSQVRKPFTQRTSSFTPTRNIYSINGDFTMIGNTNMTLQNYSNTALNSNNNMIKVDVDADPSTNNSSSSVLNFSTENQANPSCSHVVFAGLYWSARTNGTPTELEKRTIKFKGPNQSSYTTLEATSNDIYYPGDDDMYVGYTEVTSIVQQCGLGEYWAADMALTTGNGGSTGYYGGWGLVVVYENSLMQKRDITVFDGYAYVVGGTAQWELPVSGFNTVLSGNVNTKLGMIAGEGDVNITGDNFEIQKQNSSNWLLLNHANNSTTNFFNSSIYTGGNGRNPNLVNNTGMDISMFTIPNANNEVITNGQTSTTFRYSSTQDTYIIYSICMAVDAYEPSVEGFLSLLNVNGTSSSNSNITVNPGDTVQYKIQIRNKGNEQVNNARIEIPLPYAAITYLGSTTVVNAPASTTTNPYIDVNASANGSIIWNFGSLPVPANPNDVLGEMVFTLKVTEDCDLYRNYNCSAPEVEINGSISGIGNITGIELDEQPFYVGYSQNGTCNSEPVLGPFYITIDSYNWVANNCSAGDSTRDFYFCNRTTPIPITDVIGFYPAGTRFFSTDLLTEYTINNPFPSQAGVTNYKALLPSGCLLAFSLSITNNVITSTPIITNTVEYCNGATAVPLTATPSNPNYQLYYFEPGSNIAQPQITPTTSINGSYTYQVAEGPSSSCISTSRSNIIVQINENPSINAQINQIECYGSLGSIILSSSGGSGLLSYSSNNPPTQNLTSGNYNYVVIDSKGCSDTITAVIISEPVLPMLPMLACYETANWNSNTCSWDITGSQPTQPTLACYETATFNTTSCQWDVTGSQPAQPSLACYQTANFNTTTCSWDVTGTQPSAPSLACYETASFNTTSCQWDVTGSQPTQPTLTCYQSANFNTNTCSWDVTGSQPSAPSLACYETASFNTTSCQWDVTGSQPTQPTLACYQSANFNTNTCSWDVTGSQPSAPSLACYETASFNTTSCQWDVTGSQPTQPALACYQSANFNTNTCSWDVTGTQPAQPALVCYQTANFNTTTCSWDVTGSQPLQPNLACYQSANFNGTTCQWDVTGSQPAQPSLACYQSATFNNATCQWVITGCKPPKPTLACYQTAYFSNTYCRWIVSGTQPTQPTLACYQSATFNNTSCSWIVTGSQPAQPSLACYQTANFNTTTCSWDVTGTQPAQPSLACYQSANFNTNTCSWDVTGSQPTQPSLACYQTANFNTTTCSWDVSGSQPAQPSLACYQTANFNTTTCSWDVTGTQPTQPSLACYQSANFNTNTCSWDVTGSQPTQPSLACYQTANFNTTTCSWDVTGSQPAQPTLACYQSATFNNTTCQWVITGCKPPKPTLACYQTAYFSNTYCRWIVSGTQPTQPTLACYQSATFNNTSCSWIVTGSQPAQPSLACYQTANFNTTTCSWDVTGTQPAQPSLACYQSANFNTNTCSWDVTGSQPTQPSLACYQTANFNTTTCSWDVSGSQPAQPSLACYQTANFNTTTCSWVVTGSQPQQPSLACYQTANFNTTTCSWDVSGSQPVQPTLACYQTANFNTTTCSWDVTGSQPAQPSLACYQSASFNNTTCQWIITGCKPPKPTLACYQTAYFSNTYCRWIVSGTQPVQPTLACYQSATFNNTSCSWVVTGSQPAQPTLACYQTANFNTSTCSWDVTGTPNPPITTNASACTSYTWNINGQTYTQSGNYYYNSNCQDYVLSLTIAPSGNAPATPSIISGPTNNLCNMQNVVYSVTNVIGLTYNWVVPSGATIVSGQGTNSIIVNFGSTLGSCNTCTGPQITVSASNGCLSSPARCLSITLYPDKPGTITGPYNTTPNQIVTYSILPVPGATSYTWQKPAGWTIISGQGTTSIQVIAGTVRGKILVKANNDCGSSGFRIKYVNSCSTSRIIDNVVNSTTKIYPNPTNGILNIETSKSIEKIEILNLQGSIISTFGNERILDLSSYDDGIYLIRTITDEGIELKRVEVIH